MVFLRATQRQPHTFPQVPFGRLSNPQNCPQLFRRNILRISEGRKYPFCLFGGRMGKAVFIFISLLVFFSLVSSVVEESVIEIFNTLKEKKAFCGALWNIIVVIIKKSFHGGSKKGKQRIKNSNKEFLWREIVTFFCWWTQINMLEGWWGFK